MENKNYTIKDIARMSGVSAGTVDRVLHNRGDVSFSSSENVQKVLEEIDYHPNMFAIGLAAKKHYHIVCIIPYYIEHDYWYAVAAGIARAAQELRPFNVGVSYLYYRHADKSSYKEACAVLREENADAVLVAPNFREETIKLTAYLEEADIPYVFVIGPFHQIRPHRRRSFKAHCRQNVGGLPVFCRHCQPFFGIIDEIHPAAPVPGTGEGQAASRHRQKIPKSQYFVSFGHGIGYQLVDIGRRRHAHRAAVPGKECDVRRQDLTDTAPVQGRGVGAADLHQTKGRPVFGGLEAGQFFFSLSFSSYSISLNRPIQSWASFFSTIWMAMPA